MVIRDGAGLGTFDNFHQTSWLRVSMPTTLNPTAPPQGRPFGEWIAVPGCPECIHMHWRWGGMTAPAASIGFTDSNGALPRIPGGSRQNVTVGVVHVPVGAGESEQDPSDWHTLVNNESLGSEAVAPRAPAPAGKLAALAFWYDGEAFTSADQFLIHGAFFGVDQPGTPSIRDLQMSPTRFRVTLVRGSGAAKKKAKRKPKRKPKIAFGTTLRFRLSEWGEGQFAVERLLPGRVLKRKCVAPRRGRRARKEKACIRRLRMGLLFAEGGTDKLPVPFTGRIGKKALPPGNYEIAATALDLSGDASKAARRVRFTIVK